MSNGYSQTEIWLIIILLAAGTFLLRYSFLGALGGRAMPAWLMSLLRYTPVAVLPALIAPLIIWPEATGGQTDPARLVAALVTLGVGVLTRHVLGAILAGATTLTIFLYLS